MSEAVEHKRRWAEITAARMERLQADMGVPPIDEVNPEAWGALRAKLGRMAEHIREVCP